MALPDSSKVPREVLGVLSTLRAANRSAWLAGGCVRDLLRGAEAHDFDVATAARPEEVQTIFARRDSGARRVVATGAQHGTVTVLAGDHAIEVTTYRGEGVYLDGRRPEHVTFLDSIDDDLARRDLTINAMAWDPLAGELRDPFGGAKDLGAGLVRAVGDAAARFAEDGLRPLRAVRFATTLRFCLDRATRRAITSALPSFEKVAAERVRDELTKILVSGRPPSRGLELLRRTGLLARIIPELLDGVGFEQNRWHAHDVYRHTLHTLDATPATLLLRLSGLLHDIGKPRSATMRDTSQPLSKKGEHHFYDHERLGKRMALEICERLRFPKRLGEEVALHVLEHNWHYRPEWSDGTVRRHAARIGLEALEPQWALRRADLLGRGRYVEEGLSNLDALVARFASVLARDRALKITDLALKGPDVMQALETGPGPQIGEALRWLLERVLDEPSHNTPEGLRKLLDGFKSSVKI